jgi:hypothetical protein
MAQIHVIVGFRSNDLLVKTPYLGCVLLLRTPYLGFQELNYSSTPHIFTRPAPQHLTFLRDLLLNTSHFYATCSSTPHMLLSKISSTRQHPIFFSVTCSSAPYMLGDLLLRTPYVAQRQDKSPIYISCGLCSMSRSFAERSFTRRLAFLTSSINAIVGNKV